MFDCSSQGETGIVPDSEFFKSVFNNAAAGMGISRIDGSLIDVNPALCSMLGYTAEELLQLNVFDFTHPEDREKARHLYEETAAGQRTVFTYEKRYLRKAGSFIWGITTVTWVPDSEGNPAYGIAMIQDITAFKKSRQEMLAREKVNRLLIESIPLGISLVGADRRIIMVNSTQAERLGKNPEDFSGKECFREYEKREQVCAHCRADEAMRSGEPQTYVAEGLRDDGERVAVRIRVFPLPPENGKTQGFVELVENITGQVKIEEALEISEQRFRTLTDSAPVAIFEVDAQGRNVYTNPQWKAISGRSHEETLGDGWKDALHPEDRESVLERRRRCMENDQHWELDFRIVRPDGEIRHVRSFAAPTRMKDGRPQGYVGTIMDVTSKMKAIQALEESESRFRSLYEHAQIGIGMVSREGRYLQANPTLCALLGFSEAELLALTVEDLTYPDDQNLLSHTRESGKPISYEKRVVRKDGSVIWVFISGGWVYDAFGQPLYGICILKDISDRKKAEIKLDQMAFYDQVTGLHNRALLMDRLEHALARARRSGDKVAVMFLDLDRFKNINDTYNHHMGDRVLKQVAQILQRNIRESDTLARFGGDEFVIISEELRDSKEVSRFAERILELFEKPVSVGRHKFHLSLSIGISLFPQNAKSGERLLRSADSAMYRAKEKGGNTYQFYNPSEGARSRRKVKIEAKLREALERDQFILHYQPQFNLSTGKLVGMEALIRWHHPEDGIIAPGDFIPVAEETGLIIPIGRWAMEEACRQMREWKPANGLRMAVNISAQQFRHDNLVAVVAEVLKKSGLAPQRLELELTESMIMEDVEQAIKAMKKITDLGVTIAIDDFGTGYSSLAYLKRFPISRLKIDRSFVKDVTTDRDSASIAGSIIGLAHNMDLEVVAEGIETEDQMNFLLKNACWHGQGYLLGRPGSAEDVRKYVI